MRTAIGGRDEGREALRKKGLGFFAGGYEGGQGGGQGDIFIYTFLGNNLTMVSVSKFSAICASIADLTAAVGEEAASSHRGGSSSFSKASASSEVGMENSSHSASMSIRLESILEREIALVEES